MTVQPDVQFRKSHELPRLRKVTMRRGLVTTAGVGLFLGLTLLPTSSAVAATWDSPITTVYPGQTLTVSGTCDLGAPHETKPLNVYFSGIGYSFVIVGVGPGGSRNQTVTITIPSNALSATSPRLGFQCFDSGGDTTNYYNVTVVPAPSVAPVETLPPPWLKAIGRSSSSASCPSGTTPSWAQWPNAGTGGWTCEWQEV